MYCVDYVEGNCDNCGNCHLYEEEEEEDELEKELPKYIEEYNRIMKKEFGERDTKMLMSKERFYEHPYWMDEAESVCFYGGKNYAQFQLHNEGVLPAEEVDAWK